jgi:hypothetical protein
MLLEFFQMIFIYFMSHTASGVDLLSATSSHLHAMTTLQ